MIKCREALRRWTARYIPGMLMAAGLTIALGAIYAAVNLGRAFEELPHSGYDRAEFVLKQTRLERFAGFGGGLRRTSWRTLFSPAALVRPMDGVAFGAF